MPYQQKDRQRTRYFQRLPYKKVIVNVEINMYQTLCTGDYSGNSM